MANHEGRRITRASARGRKKPCRKTSGQSLGEAISIAYTAMEAVTAQDGAPDPARSRVDAGSCEVTNSIERCRRAESKETAGRTLQINCWPVYLAKKRFGGAREQFNKALASCRGYCPPQRSGPARYRAKRPAAARQRSPHSAPRTDNERNCSVLAMMIRTVLSPEIGHAQARRWSIRIRAAHVAR